MPTAHIDGRRIRDWDTFHTVFAEVLGFPDFYGRNMNAWIDCMSYLDDPQAGMSQVHGTASDPVVVHIDQSEVVPDEIMQSLNECAAFVNWRRMERGDAAILTLAYYR